MPTWSPVLGTRRVASSVLGQQPTQGRGFSHPRLGGPYFPFPSPLFLCFLPSLNLRFIQTAPSPSGPTQRGAERGSSGWLRKASSGLASFVPDLCAC